MNHLYFCSFADPKHETMAITQEERAQFGWTRLRDLEGVFITELPIPLSESQFPVKNIPEVEEKYQGNYRPLVRYNHNPDEAPMR